MRPESEIIRSGSWALSLVTSAI